MDSQHTTSRYALGHDCLANKDYLSAVTHLLASFDQSPGLHEEASFSIKYAVGQLRHNANTPLYTGILGNSACLSSQLPAQLQRHLERLSPCALLDCTAMLADQQDAFMEKAAHYVLAHPCSLVFVLDSSPAAAFMALLYRRIWGSLLLSDAGLQVRMSGLNSPADLMGLDLATNLAACIDTWVSFDFATHVASAAEYLPLGLDSKQAEGRLNTSSLLRLERYRQLYFTARPDRLVQTARFSHSLLTLLQAAKAPASAVLSALIQDQPQPVLQTGQHQSSDKVAVVVHYYYEEIWDEITAHLDQLDSDFDLFVTTTTQVAARVVERVYAQYPDARVFVSPNKGMDIVPFLNLIPLLVSEGYVAVLKLQTKKGDSHLAAIWRELMLGSLIGNTRQFDQVVSAFKQQDNLACAGPAMVFQSAPRIMYGNQENLQRLAQTIYQQTLPEQDWGFFAGTMFWARPSALLPLSQVANFSNPDFTSEYQLDGKLEHAIERFFGLIPVLTQQKIGLLQPTSTAMADVDLVVVEPGQAVGQADIGALMRQYERLDADYALLKRYALFNPTHYLTHCPELKGSRTDLLVHYLLYGTYKNISPDQAFSPAQYRALNQDVVKAYVEPYVHYLKSGVTEGRRLYKDAAALEANAAHLRYAILNHQLIDWSGLATKTYDDALVSIIVPVYSQPELTESCIESLIQCKNQQACELILVDNGSDATTAAILQRYAAAYDWIHCVSNAENLNFALGCNLGFNAAKGQHVIFLNNDTTVTDGWVDALIAPLSDPQVAAVQPKLLFPDNTIQCAGVVFNAWSSLGYPLYAGYAPDGKEANTPRQLQAITAACMALRASDFASLQGFDPVFVNGQEDVDLCLRLIGESGRHCRYEPASLVYHHEGKSAGRGKYVLRNRQVFMRRWESRLRADDLTFYQQDGVYVQQWQVDLPEKTHQGLSVYRPVLGDFPCITEFAPPFVDFDSLDEARQKGAKLDTAFKGKRAVDADRPTVLVCAHAAGVHLFGGERSFLDMLDALNSMGLNVIVSVPGIQNFDYLDAVKARCSYIYCLHYLHWKETLAPDPRSVNKFRSIIQQHQVLFVHCNTIMLREPLLAAREAGVISFMHIRELISQDEAIAKHIRLSAEGIVERIYQATDFLIANSRTTAADFDRFENTFIAPNVVQVDALDIANPVDPKRVVFGLISSNLPKKGIYELVELARRCAVSAPNAVFAFVGPKSGPEWTQDIQQIEAAVKRGELPDNMIFTGYVQTPVEAMQAVDVVLNLSLFAESFGRSVAEALAARRPVIVYDKGALAELVQDESGFVVPFKDIDALEKRVQQLCQQPELIPAMGERGRRFICAHYAPDTLVKCFDQAYLGAYCQRIDAALYRHEQGMNTALFKAVATHHRLSVATFLRPITLVIPVYNAVKETRDCIESVLKHTDLNFASLLIINDASPDPAVKPMLERWASHPRIQLVENDVNLGYTKTINKAIALAGRQDVILLNSDTLVTPGWLTGIRLAAASHPRVGTVTAMGNNSGAFSFPQQGVENLPPQGCDFNQFARRIVLANAPVEPLTLPTGNGFCMYIHRRLLDDVGLFDEVAFPRGYGEENDFCMAGMKLGYANLLSPWSYVYHVRSASFKEEKMLLIEQGALALNTKHPDYPQQVATAFSSQAMRALRQAIQKTVDTLQP